MIKVSNADRVVFPDVNVTKGDVVAYYQRIAPKMLPHLLDRPVSINRFPKGLAAKGFFQKNVPPHYPETIRRLEIPRSKEASKRHRKKGEPEPENFTAYPVLDREEHIAYLANQGALEIHVPTARAADQFRPSIGSRSSEAGPPEDAGRLRPDRVVIDLDPPPEALERVRRAALFVRDALGELGLKTVPVATGSKGYHVVAAIVPSIDADVLGDALQQLAVLLAAKKPEELTTVFRVAARGERVFVDWLRNRVMATVIAPWSLRARPKATVAVPLAWNELEKLAPDAFTIADVNTLVDREDSLATLARSPIDASAFVAAVNAEFEKSGLEIESFDRFRS